MELNEKILPELRRSIKTGLSRFGITFNATEFDERIIKLPGMSRLANDLIEAYKKIAGKPRRKKMENYSSLKFVPEPDSNFTEPTHTIVRCVNFEQARSNLAFISAAHLFFKKIASRYPGTYKKVSKKHEESACQFIKSLECDTYKTIFTQDKTPLVANYERKMFDKLGVSVNFPNDENLAKEIYEACKKVKNRECKLPSHIIFFKRNEKTCPPSDHVGGLAEKKSPIVFLNAEKGSSYEIAGLKNNLNYTVRGRVFHEIGHINNFPHMPPNGEEIFAKVSSDTKAFLKSWLDQSLEELNLNYPKTNYEDNNDPFALLRKSFDSYEEQVGVLFLIKEVDETAFNTFVDTAKRKLENSPDSIEKKIATQVSIYALSNPNGIEFVAEVFAGLMLGKKFDEKIMKLYEDLGGVIPAQDPAAVEAIEASTDSEIPANIEVPADTKESEIPAAA